jgi:hypothetical protein
MMPTTPIQYQQSTVTSSSSSNLRSMGGSMDDGNSPLGAGSSSMMVWNDSDSVSYNMMTFGQDASTSSLLPPAVPSTTLSFLQSNQQQQQGMNGNQQQMSMFDSGSSSANTSARSSGIIIGPKGQQIPTIGVERSYSGISISGREGREPSGRDLSGRDSTGRDSIGRDLSGRDMSMSERSSSGGIGGGIGTTGSGGGAGSGSGGQMFSMINEFKNSRIYKEQQLLFLLQNHILSIPVPSLRFDRINMATWSGNNTLLYDFDDLQRSSHHVTNFYLIDELKLKQFFLQHHNSSLRIHPSSSTTVAGREEDENFDFENLFKFSIPLENSSPVSCLDKVSVCCYYCCCFRSLFLFFFLSIVSLSCFVSLNRYFIDLDLLLLHGIMLILFK